LQAAIIQTICPEVLLRITCVLFGMPRRSNQVLFALWGVRHAGNNAAYDQEA